MVALAAMAASDPEAVRVWEHYLDRWTMLNTIRTVAAIAAVVRADIVVREYSARLIKQAIVGTGAADKTQVQHMVGVLLNIRGKLQADAADGLAVALCHAHSRHHTILGSKHS